LTPSAAAKNSVFRHRRVVVPSDLDPSPAAKAQRGLGGDPENFLFCHGQAGKKLIRTGISLSVRVEVWPEQGKKSFRKCLTIMVCHL